MIKKCLIIKHGTFANTRIVTGLLSKFKQVTGLGLNYRPITLDWGQSYKEQARCTCRGFQKSLASLAALERRQKPRERIEQLLFKKNRLNDWDRNFLSNIQHERKLSPKQLAQLDRIEKEVGGLK